MSFQLAFDSSYFWSAFGGLSAIATVLGVYIFIAPDSLLKKLSEKVAITENRIGYSLLRFSEKRFSLPWHETIIILLNNLFGERLFSAKSFARTNIHSFVVCIIIMYVLMIWTAVFNSSAYAEANVLVLLLSGPLFSFGIVSANFITDFVAVGLCRWSIKRTLRSGLLSVLLGVLFMFTVCTLLGVASIMCKEAQIIGSELLWAQHDDSTTRNPHVALVQHTLAFLTTFSVIMWGAAFLLLKIISTIVGAILKAAQFPASLSTVVDFPLRCLAALTVTLALVLIFLSSISIS